jgi:hypothetical protein
MTDTIGDCMLQKIRYSPKVARAFATLYENAGDAQGEKAVHDFFGEWMSADANRIKE